MQDSWEFPSNFLLHIGQNFLWNLLYRLGAARSAGLGMFWDHTHDELFEFPSVFPSLVRIQLPLTFSDTVWGMVQYPVCVYYAGRIILHIALHMIFHAHALHACKPHIC